MASGTPVGNMVIKVDLDSVGVEKSMTGLQRQLRSSNKAMGAQLSAFNRGDKSAAKYGVMIEGLSNRHRIQGRMVQEAREKYDHMSKTYGENSVKAQQASQQLNEQIARYQETERELNSVQAEFKEFQRIQATQNKGWYKVADSMENYGGKLKNVGSQMDNVGSRMTSSITKPAMVATTAAVGLAGALGWKRLTGLDAAKAQLKGLGYNTEEVGRISEQVTNAIDGGMTTMAEGTAVAAGALAAGVKEGKDLERYIKLVGDAAVGANRPVEEMAQIFNRVQGSGKLMTEELNSIEQGMPGFSKAMSKHLGVSTQEFRKMVTEGKVSSEDFLDVMEDFAGGMASAYAESWDGMIENTKAYIGIIGESFLEGIFQDSKKSLADFVEMLKSPEIQQRAAEMGEVTREAFNKMKDSVMGVVDWYKNLDEGQKKLINRLGLVAVAAGPVLQMTGKLAGGLGSVMEVTGKLSKSIGLSGGAGLIGALTKLGPGAAAGVAVAGLAAVGVGIYNVAKKSDEFEAINIDVAKSLTDEAIELEKSADTFDKLSDKANLSNEELAELNGLNEKISNSSNPGEIEELQKQYEYLAEKSGLSKEELEDLFGANADIIEQSPNTKTAISSQGEAWAENTDAAREYLETMYDASIQQLDNERERALERMDDLHNDIADKNKEINGLVKEQTYLSELNKMTDEERSALIYDLQQEQYGMKESSREYKDLQEEINTIAAVTNGEYVEQFDNIGKQIDKKQESVQESEEELATLEAFDEEYANILLKQAGINEEGEEGLAQLDKTLEKNKGELADLDQKLEKNGSLTKEEQARHDELTESNAKMQETKEYLFDQLGIYKDINSLANGKLEKLDAEGQKKIDNLAKDIDIKDTEKDIISQIDKKNEGHKKERDELIKNLEKQGASKKEIDKQTVSLDKKIGKNADVKKQILKELGIWGNLDEGIKKGINSEIKKGKQVDKTRGGLDKQGDQIDKNNKKTDIGTKKEEERTKEAGKGTDKVVTAKDKGSVKRIDKLATAQKSKKVKVGDYGTISKLNRSAQQAKNKQINVKDGGTIADLNRRASNPVTKTIKIAAKAAKTALNPFKLFAKGTPPGGHTGGPAVIGDGGGRELVKLPNGKAFLSPDTDTLLNLPKGTHVIPHGKTEKLLKSIPKFADGTNDWNDLFSLENKRNSELMKLLALTDSDSEGQIEFVGSPRVGTDNSQGQRQMVQLLMEQNKQLKTSNGLLTKLLEKDTNLYVDGDEMTNKVNERNALKAATTYF